MESPKPLVRRPVELVSSSPEDPPKVKVVLGVGGQRTSALPASLSTSQLRRSASRGSRFGLKLQSINPT